MSGPIRREALIHDLAIVLAGSLHPSSRIGPAPRLAARRMQDVLSIEDGEMTAQIERRLFAALGLDEGATEYRAKHETTTEGGQQ